MEYYSTVKKGIIKYLSKLMGLEKILLNEISWTQIYKCHMFSLICHS